jgi:hypothetical protein
VYAGQFSGGCGMTSNSFCYLFMLNRVAFSSCNQDVSLTGRPDWSGGLIERIDRADWLHSSSHAMQTF